MRRTGSGSLLVSAMGVGWSVCGPDAGETERLGFDHGVEGVASKGTNGVRFTLCGARLHAQFQFRSENSLESRIRHRLCHQRGRFQLIPV